MKTIKNYNITLFLIVFVAFALFAFKPLVNYQEAWTVPTKYKTMVNPVVGDDDATELGSELYAKHCKSCHGKTGLGDGTKAAELETDCGDFSLEEFHQQTDGELYYKLTFGRDDMPAFDKKLADEEERWSVVNYIRTMKE